jgi:uroporphyrinogen-III synthase
MRADPLVLLTRARGENGDLIARLRSLGIAAEERPCIRIEQFADPAPLREAVAALTADDLLVITSAAGARAVERASGGLGCRAPTAAVGVATRAACAAAGLRVAFMPSVPSARALAEEVPLPRGTVLLARSDRAAPEPAEILWRRGAVVGEVVAYRTVPVPLDRVPDADAVVFASPSAVEGYAAAMAQPRLTIAIGPATADRVRALLGIDPLIATPDDDALALAIKSALEGSRAATGR